MLKRYRFWNRQWWRQNSNRLGWGLTAAAAALLMGLGMYIDARSEQAAAPAASAIAEEQPAAPALTIDPSALPAPGDTEAPGDAEPAQPDAPPADVPAVSAEPFLPEPPLSALVLQRGWGYGYNVNTEDYRFHRGVDLEAAAGDPVYAADSGTAEQVYEDAYWGGVVVLDHGNGWRSVYRCLSPLVAQEQQVAAGTLIGRLLEQSPAEAAQGSHLHFELELEGESQDPAPELGL